MNLNGTTPKELEGFLKTLPGVHHAAIGNLTPRLALRPQAQMFTFVFKYRHHENTIAVVAQPGDSLAMVEDAAAKAAETWITKLDQEEHKRPPTAEEKKQIGHIIEDFRKAACKRRDSSTGKLYFPGLN